MRIASLAAILIPLVLAGCGSTPKLRFQVTKDIPEQTINSSIAPCQVPVEIPFLGSPFDVTISQAQDFPEQNTNVQKIESAKLDSLSLTLTQDSSETTWDFLTGLELYAEADGLPRELFASIGEETPSAIPIEVGATRLDLRSAGLQLAPYLKASGGFTLTSEAIGCPPDQDATFTGRIRLNIVAEPL